MVEGGRSSYLLVLGHAQGPEGEITSKAKAFDDLQVQNNDVGRENFDRKERLKQQLDEEAHSAVSWRPWTGSKAKG